jgi:PII-like signaling protein
MVGEQVLLRMFMLSTDQVRHGLAGLWGMPAYEWIVQRARRRQMAGATVLRGVFGFGRRGMAPKRGWHIAHDLPVIVEMVDAGEAVARFYREEILPHVAHGTVTLERAAVLKGSMGFGAHSVLHTAKVLELSADLPVVIEVVDTEEKIRRLLPVVDAMVQEGMITMEAVRIVAYRRAG